MKKLNNKGFTLVELMAVVIILAVVMGIAFTSVTSAMNNSRKSSLTDSAKSVARAFNTKYSESVMTGTMDEIYKEETGVGYDFSTATTSEKKIYKLNESLKDELNLSKNAYVLDSYTDDNHMVPVTALNALADGVNYSFIAFDGNTVVACLVAKKGGSYYLANAATSTTTKVFDKTVTFASGTMWACSTDNSASWLGNATE